MSLKSVLSVSSHLKYFIKSVLLVDYHDIGIFSIVWFIEEVILTWVFLRIKVNNVGIKDVLQGFCQLLVTSECGIFHSLDYRIVNTHMVEPLDQNGNHTSNYFSEIQVQFGCYFIIEIN